MYISPKLVHRYQSNTNQIPIKFQPNKLENDFVDSTSNAICSERCRSPSSS